MSINNIKTIENGHNLPSEAFLYNSSHLWRMDSGFSAFCHRIEAALHEQGLGISLDVDDEILSRYYRNGESETYVLAAFGCESWN
jgi:hypothetical protein